jgi:hypothetical protein
MCKLKTMNFSLALPLVLGLFINSCGNGQTKNQSTACENFQTGTFEMYVDELRIMVERTEEFQFEKMENGNSKYSVTWSSHCEYELELLDTEIEFMKKNIGRKYQINIVDTQQDQYSYEVRVEGIDFVDKGTLKKIKSTPK